MTVETMASSALSSPMTLKNSSHTIIPKLIYGTAWKKDRTAEFVYRALKTGFRAIDTAAQPRHYQENLVGDGIRSAIKEGLVTRDELYVRPLLMPTSVFVKVLTDIRRFKRSSRHSVGRTTTICRMASPNP
jgi:diketogulonate reductase-like aldo/keto reductase